MPYTRDLNATTDLYSGFDRTRVEDASTGFFEGREFRTFRELSIPTSTTQVVKLVLPVNTVVKVKTSGNSNFSSSVDALSQNARGLAAGTYYIRLQNLSGTDVADGTMYLRWEERPLNFFA